ncbi:MAG: CPBP family intramembrane glutamic endopeptidase [Aggregatilineales bacterium]|nr:CPBP family intramembrane metalloprotease [Chloroflexota bacterium]HOA23913.1 CPBP family intramembrane metalloprotease [Aggregatilineales bacterium]HQE20257.1 CPBP family intramembrane metalloprotease [Aggregatilineales bacterium]
MEYPFDETLQAQPAEAFDKPSPLGRWLLAGVLFMAYLPMQVLLAIPAVAVAVAFGGLTSLEDLLESELVLWMTLGAAALAAFLTIVVALAWPWVWRLLTSRDIPLREWIAWRPPKRLPLWAVPLLTLPLLIVVGALVSLIFGPTEIEIQLQLFSTPALRVVSAIVVSTVVPVAEEFIFRGAIYSALLPPEAGEAGWRRHALPFVVTTLLFAAVHLLAGFETAAAIIQILILSSFLTALRTVTGSVMPSTLAHLVWNFTAAIGLILTSVVDMPV